MAEITCTIKDFHKYIGPMIRNIVQYMTKKRKKELNYICQECKEYRELEAAHISGNSRKNIIDEILKEFILDKDKELVKVDLDKFSERIIEAHKPLDKYFRFLCSECHIKYDSIKEMINN